MAGDLHLKESAVRRHKRKRSKRRVPINIDLTPMVDIAFLLLIFYMVTTIFVMPQAMEINQPKSEVVEVADLLTIRVDSTGKYWWNIGLEKPDNLPEPFPPVQIIMHNSEQKRMSRRQFLFDINLNNPDLNTLFLIHRKANYKDMVDLLDEIEMVERDINRFHAEQNQIPIELLPDELRFSYRYAFGEWAKRDDKIMRQCINTLKLGEGESQ